MFGWFYFSINAGSFISSILCPCSLRIRSGDPVGIWNSRHSDGHRYFVLLGRSQENGPRAGRRLSYLKETFSKEGLITLLVSQWFTFLFWFSGRFGE